MSPQPPQPIPLLKLKGRRSYIWKAFKWYVANMIVGSSPLIALAAVCFMSKNERGVEELQIVMYNEAILLFVSCTLMGSTIIDFHMGHFYTRRYVLLVMYFVPTLTMVLLLLYYLLNKLHYTNAILFDFQSPFIKIILGISFVYCILGRFYLYLKEDEKLETERN